MADIIVDTDILIDVGRGVQDAIDFLQRQLQQSLLAISCITHMELLVGCRNKTEQREAERFLGRFECIKLNEPIADFALELLRRYRLSHGLLIADALIAATCLALSKPLATKNRRDYRFIAGLELLSYP